MLDIHIYNHCVGHDHILCTCYLVKFCFEMNVVVDQFDFNFSLVVTEICFSSVVVGTLAFSY